MNELQIIQDSKWQFFLKNWPRSFGINYDDVKWIYGEDFEDMAFDIPKAKQFYSITD